MHSPSAVSRSSVDPFTRKNCLCESVSVSSIPVLLDDEAASKCDFWWMRNKLLMTLTFGSKNPMLLPLPPLNVSIPLCVADLPFL